MTRRRWVYIDGVAHEVGDDYVPETRAQHRVVGDRHYDGLRATDGTDISTRTKHREYMRINGLTTVDDFKDTWAKQQAQREAYRRGEGGGAVKREHIERAIHDLSRRK